MADVKCLDCKHFKECSVDYMLYNDCRATGMAFPFTGMTICSSFELNPKKTNFAKVTESPEALADFIEKFLETHVDECELKGEQNCSKYISCKKCITAWLKQKARDKEGGKEDG